MLQQSWGCWWTGKGLEVVPVLICKLPEMLHSPTVLSLSPVPPCAVPWQGLCWVQAPGLLWKAWLCPGSCPGSCPQPGSQPVVAVLGQRPSPGRAGPEWLCWVGTRA